MRKICFKIHKWLSLVLGVFMSILCFSGEIMLFCNNLTVKKLHRFLFMVPENVHGGMSAGRLLMDLTAICMTLVLITGIVIWWPKNKEMLKNRLTIDFRKGFGKFVHDSHVVLGIFACIFLLLMTITGPAFGLNWYREGLMSIFGIKALKMLHLGLWGGWVSKIIYAVAAVIGGLLPISGYYLWWHKRQYKKHNHNNKESI